MVPSRVRLCLINALSFCNHRNSVNGRLCLMSFGFQLEPQFTFYYMPRLNNTFKGMNLKDYRLLCQQDIIAALYLIWHHIKYIGKNPFIFN